MNKVFYNNIADDLDCAFTAGEYVGDMHFHLHYEINFVIKGGLSVINNGISVECRAPCILIHAPCSFHAVISEKNVPYERLRFHFNDNYIKNYNPSVLFENGIFSERFSLIPLTGEAGKAILPYLALFDKNNNDKEVNNRYFAYLLDLVRFFYNTRLKLSARSVDANNLGYIGSILAHISENYHSPLTVDSLASSFFVSKSKLNRDFKALIGKTLKQYIIDVRISNAMRFITSGESVIETASKCGFTDESHFIKTFRERVGRSPGKYTY